MSGIPNLLSLYRLAAAPVAVWLALEGYRDAFFILIFISLATDLIDGPIARMTKQVTSTGAKLDTLADACTLIAGVIGLYLFEADNIRPDLPWLYAFLGSYVAAAGASLVKFRGLPAYHLYVSKAAAILSGLFFVWIYFQEYSRPLFLLLIGLGLLANVESLLVTLVLKTRRTDVGSLFLIVTGTKSK